MQLESIQGQVALSTQSRRFASDADGLPGPQLTPGAEHLCSLPRDLDVFWFKYVPIRDEDASSRELWHEMRRNKITRAVKARFATLRLKFLQSVADRNVWADYEHYVRIARIVSVSYLVENAPCRQHSHNRRLAGAGRHLAGMASKRQHSLSLCLRARLIDRNVNSLQEVRARLGEKDNRFGRFHLGKKQPMPTPLPAPISQQLHRCPGHAALAAQRQWPPLGEFVANSVDQFELDGRSGVRPIIQRFASRRSIKIHGGPSAGTLLRRIELRYAPICLGFLERRVEDRLGNFVRVHGSTPKARQIASSFSPTSG